MRTFLLLLLSAAALPVQAQPAPPMPIRAWFGPTIMFSTDLAQGVGAGYDVRVTIERPDVAGVSVVLGGQMGVDEDDNTTEAVFGAFLAGRSVPVAEDAFLHLAAGIGYTRTHTGTNYYCDPYTCSGDYRAGRNTEIGPIIPVRAELHVPYRRDRSFGIVAQAMLYGDVPNRVGLGLHYSFGRNLSAGR
jgi:hypothetical protein